MRKLLPERIRDLFELSSDAAQESQTIISVKKSIPFRGSNLWILIFAIFTASIGLNINSTAVIIGAMLISPLMGPIVGTGLSLGINDFKMLKDSLFHLAVATVIGIVTSALYFSISPLREAQSELLARTSPNIYDVLIAFFGGAAGIIGASRVEKGNVIPGVAIATALMPPLCTVGYCLATGQMVYLLGAFYLYLINCTFICISTFLIVKYLGFRSVERVEEKRTTKIHRSIMLVVFLMIAPAIFFAYQLTIESRFRQNSNQFIKEVFTDKGSTVIFKNIHFQQGLKSIELAFLERRYSEAELDSIENLLPLYELKGTKLLIRQNLNELTTNDWKSVLDRINSESSKLKNLEEQIAVIKRGNSAQSINLLKEIKVFEPDAVGLTSGYAARARLAKNGNIIADSVFVVNVKHLNSKPTSVSQEKMLNFLKLRLGIDSIHVHFHE